MPNSRYITEDVLAEIFLGLPFNSVCKFRCVSKSWSSLLSNPSFINRFVRTSCGVSTPWMLVSPYRFNNFEFDGDIIRKSSLFSISSTHLHHEFISIQGVSSLKLLLDSKTSRHVVPLASSNGILLCSSHSHEYSPGDSYYFICNPLTKQFVQLPSGDRHPGIQGFVFESSAGTYKVIHIEYEYYSVRSFYLQIFSSDTGEWTPHEVSCSSQGVSLRCNTIHSIVNHRRIWYWIDGEGDKMVAYNDSTGKCKIFGLPEGRSRNINDNQQQCLGESKGILCYGKITRVRDVSTVSVWVFKDGYQDKTGSTRDVKIPTWRLVWKNTEIQDHACGLPRPRRIQYSFVAFSPVDPNVVIIKCHQGTDFLLYEAAYNIRTRKSEVLRSSHPVESKCPRIVVTLQPTIIPSTTTR